MATNFYYRTNICSECNRFNRIHIGRRSCGWTFLFRAWKEESYPRLLSYKNWLKFFKDEPGVIVDEYGKEYSVEEFKNVIEDFKDGKKADYDGVFQDDEGHSFDTREFF